ncbi:MAG TPA: protein kinase, partial [Planctomycetota bacterium]
MTKHTCPTCGATVPGPGAACRRCLMELAARPPTGEEAAPIASGAPRPGTPPPTTEELAPLFPELELLDLLGAGGMGAVYRARQRRLGRAVALKLLHGELTGDPVFVERFLREAQALAKLAHPGIVAVHDFGERGGRCYLVMEFVDGANLRQLLKQGLLAP